MKRPMRPLMPLVWLTVTGGTGTTVATSNPWTYSPQLKITILEARVAAS